MGKGKADPVEEASQLVPNENRVWVGLVTKYKKGKPEKKPVPLVVTPYSLGFPDLKKKVLKPEYFWIDLAKVEEADPSVTLTFGSEVVQLNWDPEAWKTVKEMLQNVFTKDELERIGLQDSGTGTLKLSLVAKRPLVVNKGKPVEPATQGLLMSVIEAMPRSLYVGQDQLSRDVSPILFTLRALRSEELTLPPDQGGWKEMSRLVPLPWKYVASFEPLSNGFGDFCVKVKENRGNVCGICCTPTNDSEMASVMDLVAATGMNSLGISGLADVGMLTRAIPPSLSTTLMMLVVTGRGLNLDEMIPQFAFLRGLSFCGSEVNISQVFHLLNRSGYVNLSLLDLTTGVFDGDLSFFGEWNLPRLQRLQLDQVAWAPGSLAGFLTGLFQRVFNNGLKLSLKNAGLQQPDVDAAMEALSKANTSQLLEFYWNGNGISELLFPFLQRSVNLERLGLRNCLDANEELLKKLGQAIAPLQNLRALLLNLKQGSFPGNGMVEFLNALVMCTSLRELDVSQCQLNREGFDAIKRLIDTLPELQLINVDCSDVTDVEICDLVGHARDKTVVAYPIFDLKRLTEQGLPQDKIDEIRRAFASNCQSRLNVAQESEGPFPFAVFEARYEQFPRFVDDDTLRDLDRQVMWVQMQSPEPATTQTFSNPYAGLSGGDGPSESHKQQDAAQPPSDPNDSEWEVSKRNQKIAGKDTGSSSGSSEPSPKKRSTSKRASKKLGSNSEDEDSSPKKQLKDKKSSKKRGSDSEDEDSSPKKQLKGKRSSKKFGSDSEDEDSSPKKQVKGKRSSKKFGSDSEDEDSSPKKQLKGKRSSKKFGSDSEDEDSSPKKGSKIVKGKGSTKFGSSSDEDLPKRRSAKKQVSDDDSDRGAKRKASGKKKTTLFESSDEEERSPKKASRKKPVSDDSDDNIRSRKRSKKRGDSSSEEQQFAKKGSKRKAVKDEESDSDQPRKGKASKKVASWKQKKLEQESSESEPEPVPVKRLSGKKVLETDSSDDGGSIGKQKGSLKSSLKASFTSGKRPKKDQYQVPLWEFPKELSQTFDIDPTCRKLQQEFSLSMLRDSI